MIAFGKRISYDLCVGDLCEHYSLLGSLLDLLSVCVKDCMVGHFSTHSSDTKSSPLVEESYLDVYDCFVSMCVTHYR